ncbi:MAG: HigA family addiction module antitoxin [Bacillota bacterium]|nr:HigA family addiction module antitoxin [Bacillota bacterium]
MDINLKNNKGLLNNVHPAEVLEEEFLKPLGITSYQLAKETNIPQTRISEILKKRRSITCNTALKFAKYFGTTPQFWISLQNSYDLEEENKRIQEELNCIKPHNLVL